jgi:hypothetical protein
MHDFEGPYIVTRLLDHSGYELSVESGKLRESSTVSNCDGIRELAMKRKYKNEKKVSQLIQGRTTSLKKERDMRRTH